jgi:hypothetical protein
MQVGKNKLCNTSLHAGEVPFGTTRTVTANSCKACHQTLEKLFTRSSFPVSVHFFHLANDALMTRDSMENGGSVSYFRVGRHSTWSH